MNCSRGRALVCSKHSLMVIILLQVLLSSSALETTVSSCIHAPLALEREEKLRKMLNSMFSAEASSHLIAPLATAIIGLGQGLDSDAQDVVQVVAVCSTCHCAVSQTAATGQCCCHTVRPQLCWSWSRVRCPPASPIPVICRLQAARTAVQAIVRQLKATELGKAQSPAASDGTGDRVRLKAVAGRLRVMLQQYTGSLAARWAAQMSAVNLMSAEYSAV